MTIIVSSLTVAQAATVINVLIAIIQFTLPLFLAILLIHFTPKVNTALAWNFINQTLHSTLLPTLLRTDSNNTSGASLVVRVGTLLITFSTALLAITSVVLPLGLRNGTPRSSSPIPLNAHYVRDTSPLALATTSDRHSFTYGSKCRLNATTGCDPIGITAVPSNLSDIFHSTPHGPFSIQYRQFYNTDNQTASSGYVSSSQALLLRNDTFAVEGLVIDMSDAHPGIGFINHTLPASSTSRVDVGGEWSQDVLFLEPVTSCVDTNLTFEYVLEDGLLWGADMHINSYNITDRGGFYDLANFTLDNMTYPDGYNAQDIDPRTHAYIGAVMSNEQTMLGLNTSRTNSFPNKTYTLTEDNGAFDLPFHLNKIIPTGLHYFFRLDNFDPNVYAKVSASCTGFGGRRPVSVDTAHVRCGVLFGPPLRMDGGENNVYEPGSSWRQSLHACASATRASIQTFSFSLPSFGNSSIPLLNVTRGSTNHTVLWGMEKSDALIIESYPLWGRIDEEQMDTSAIWTVKSEHFMLPANDASFGMDHLPEGSPQNAHAPVWGWVYNPFGLPPPVGLSLSDYTGQSDYSIKSKYQDLILRNGQGGGAEMILNLIWTDIISNQLLGTVTNNTLMVAVNFKSLEYDFRFSIPGYILGLIWLPVLLSAMFLLISKQVRWTYMKAYFNHLSIGRVITGQSALGVVGGLRSKPTTLDETELDGGRNNWAKTNGRAGVVLDLDLDRAGSSQPEMIRSPRLAGVFLGEK